MQFGLFTVFDNYKEKFDRTPEELIHQVLDQTEVADHLGYHSVWFAEHHFSEYGILTSPHVLLTAAAQRTKDIRLGVSIVTLPFHHPIQVAEDYALLDVLSNGRLNLGLGSGCLPYEFAGFNLDAKDKAFRFNDALAVIEKAWSGETFSHKESTIRFLIFSFKSFRSRNMYRYGSVPSVLRELSMWEKWVTTSWVFHMCPATPLLN